MFFLLSNHQTRMKNSFFFQEGYCFIDNLCVQRAVTDPGNRCKVCDPGRNNFKWSEKQGIL